MAGRPKKQFERINEINSRATTLYRDLDLFCPDMHKQRAGCGDRLGQAWLTALEAAGQARQAIHGLRVLLALRAGMGELADLESEDGENDYDETCNPTADDATEDSIIVVDCDAATLETWSERFKVPIPLILERVRVGWNWENAIVNKADAPIDRGNPTDDAIPAAQPERR